MNLVEEALRPGARLVVQVPIERRRQEQPLSGLESQGVHVGDENKKARELLAALYQPELMGELDLVGVVGAAL